MARLLPKFLLTALAIYVVWADSTSEEPVSTFTWILDAAIVAIAASSWLALLREKPKNVEREYQ